LSPCRATSGGDGRQLEILYVEGAGFRINNEENFIDREQSRFFTDLSRVRAWYGGVRQDMLDRYALI